MLAVVVVVSCSPSVNAEDTLPLSIFDYNDYVTNVVVDGENDVVTVDLPVAETEWQLYSSDGSRISRSIGFDDFFWYANPDDLVDLYVYPFGSHNRMSLSNIPAGTKGTLFFSFDVSASYDVSSLVADIYYCDKDGNILRDSHYPLTLGSNQLSGLYAIDFELNKASGEVCVMLRISAGDIHVYESVEVEVTLLYYKLQMSILSLYREGGLDTALLAEISRQLAEQGKTLDDLAGDIGDEMQGVIDHEKQESQSSGNKFVDQILGALPDPSTDVLAALKSLTDATAYDGTDAVLPIPAIVLPAVEGLFDETVIWGGTEFDFGEYLGIIPSSLLTLVQSLFTIAIVLFCVYELKGIISYCLTLRESKGG